MKKFKFRVLSISTIVFSVLLSSLWASAQEPYTLTDADLDVNEDGVITYCDYDFAIKDIIIPEMADGKQIKGIKSNVFDYEGITSVTLPSSLTSIGDEAFYKNELTSVSFPEGLTSIGVWAFGDNQLKSVSLPSTLTSIERAAFSGNQLSTLNLPSGLTSIGDNAFYKNSLTDLTLPESVISIGNNAFSYNPLTSVSFSEGLTSIGTHAFYMAPLTSVTFPDGLTSIGNFAFYENKLTSVEFPSSLTTIGRYAFQFNQLTSVTFSTKPSSLKSIGEFAFSSNSGLTRIVLPTNHKLGTSFLSFVDSEGNTVNAIEDFNKPYFVNSTPHELTESDLTVVEGVITECMYNFVNSEIIIPEEVNGVKIIGIGEAVFREKDITSVTLPSSLTSIGDRAFGYNQLTSVTFPEGLTAIGSEAFSENQLTSVTFPDGLTSIGDNAFHRNALTSVKFSDGLTSIGESTFRGNKLSSVTFPSSLITIGNYAFNGNQLTSVTFSDGLASIGNYAFQTNRLASVTFPSSLTTIGDEAFSSNNLLTSVVFEDDSNLTKIGGNAFSRCDKLTSIRLPMNSSIPGVIGYVDSNGNTYQFGGEITDFSVGYFSRLDEPYELTSDDVEVTNGNIDTCYYNFANKNIIIPESLDNQEITGIGINAFASRGIVSVQLPSTLTTIGENAFSSNSITSLTIPSSIQIIGNNAFYNNNLTSLTLPSSVQIIGKSAFTRNSLTSLTLPSSVQIIDSYAFSINSITSLTLPSSVQIIGQGAFSRNELTAVSFEEKSNLFEIGVQAFSNNLNLQSVKLPKDQPDFRGYLEYYSGSLKGTLALNPEGEYIIPRDGFESTYKTYFSTVEITFNPNGGEGEEVVKTYDIDTEQTFAPIFTREGYTLKEWSTTTSGTSDDGSIKYSTNEQHNVGHAPLTLYAQWDDKAVITYKDGELTQTQSGVIGTTVALLDETVFDPEEGYTSVNWNTEADGSGTMYAFGFSDFSVPMAGITLYLIKTANPATLTYKANYEDATEGDKTQDSNTDQSVMLLGSEAFTRAGYSFSGWNTESDGSGDSFAFENDYMTPSGGMTFYAQWEPNESMLTYYPNYEGTAEVSKEESSFTDAEVTLLGSDAFSRVDHTLSGWSSDPNAQEATYEVGASFTMPVDGADLYAVWALNTDLFYYANYEGGSTEPIEYKSYLGAKVSLGDGVSFVRDDYAISGWNTQANGGEESRYKPGEEYEVPSGGMTFYAEWSMKATLTYHANYEGSSDMQSVESYDKEEVSLGDGVSFVRDGFVLTGWNTQEDGNGDSFGVGDDYMTPLEGMTFYAVWSESATVTFVSNYEGSTSEDVPMASYVGEALTLPGETFTRVGYTLTGWNAQSDGLGDSFALGDVYMTLSGGMTFYAVWEANEVALTYNANYEGSTNQDIRQDSRTDESVMLLGSDAFTRAGYTLTSWNTQPDGLGDSFALGVDYVTPSEGMTFYAQWEANEVVLSYNANYEGSTNQDIRQDSRTDESVMLLGSNAFTREGYTLTDWNTQPDGLGDSFAFEDDYVTPSEGMTFYAVWEKEETVLSLSDELNGSTMQSYPNPVQTMLTVERSKAMRGQVNVRVFNMVGKEVYSKVYGVSDDYMEVDFSALPMGMYFLQMSDENGDSERTRIMKR